MTIKQKGGTDHQAIRGGEQNLSGPTTFFFCVSSLIKWETIINFFFFIIPSWWKEGKYPQKGAPKAMFALGAPKAMIALGPPFLFQTPEGQH